MLNEAALPSPMWLFSILCHCVAQVIKWHPEFSELFVCEELSNYLYVVGGGGMEAETSCSTILPARHTPKMMVFITSVKIAYKSH